MNISLHINDYRNKLDDGLKNLDHFMFKEVVNVLVNAFNARANIFVCGNGGSAAISEHFTCDHSKGINSNTNYFPKFISLTSNVSLLTAYANDNGYTNVFSEQINNFAENGDVLIAITSSGNSPNIIKAVDTAKNLGLTVITFTGFDGGIVRNKSYYNFHIPVNNYGVVEDCHHIIMHMLAQYIRKRDTTVDLSKVKL